MYYRRLGSTGLMVSEISFGTIPVLQGSVPVLPDYFNLSEDEAVAVMEHAFDLFYSGDKSRNRKDRHMGMGLFLTRKILGLHNLELTLENLEDGVRAVIRRR